MKLQLPDSVSSPQDVKALIMEVRGYARWFSHASIKKQAGGGNIGQPAAVSPAALSLIKNCNGGKALTQESLDKLVSDLADFEASAPQLTITLAAPPSAGLKKTLSGWCRQNVEPNVLVNFQFDSTILGGLVVRWRSHIFDWSFRRQILAARGAFPEVLRRV